MDAALFIERDFLKYFFVLEKIVNEKKEVIKKIENEIKKSDPRSINTLYLDRLNVYRGLIFESIHLRELKPRATQILRQIQDRSFIFYSLPLPINLRLDHALKTPQIIRNIPVQLNSSMPISINVDPRFPFITTIMLEISNKQNVIKKKKKCEIWENDKLITKKITKQIRVIKETNNLIINIDFNGDLKGIRMITLDSKFLLTY